MNQTTEPFSLKEAIALGEYQPETLSKYSEWEMLSGHAYEAKQNIERQIKALREDKERLYLEYSKLT